MRGGGGTAEAAEDAERFGFPEGVIAAIAETGKQGTVEIWADNQDIVEAFAAVVTQWRVTPIGMAGVHYIGLDYAAARAGLELAGVAVTRTLWEGVRVMEREALTWLNKA